MEAFGDAVVAGEAPHRYDFLRPGGESLAELYQLRQAGLAQLVNGAQKARHQLLALLAGAVFFQQQVAEALFEAIDSLQNWVLRQVRRLGEAVDRLGGYTDGAASAKPGPDSWLRRHPC